MLLVISQNIPNLTSLVKENIPLGGFIQVFSKMDFFEHCQIHQTTSTARIGGLENIMWTDTVIPVFKGWNDAKTFCSNSYL